LVGTQNRSAAVASPFRELRGSELIVPVPVLFRSLAAALVVTLVTLAMTHHSSRLDPADPVNLLPQDADGNRAALASMTHPREHSQTEQPTDGDGSAGDDFSGGSSIPIEVNERAHTHVHHNEWVGAVGASKEDALEAYVTAVAEKRRKQEVLKQELQDEGYLQKLVAAAAEQIRNGGDGAQAADGSGDTETSTQAEGGGDDDGGVVASLAEDGAPSAAPSPSPSAADAPTPALDPVATASAETSVRSAESASSYADVAPGPAPSLVTKDEGFEDASWAEDDYRTSSVRSKDPGAVNRLHPTLNNSGAPSDKTEDELMKKLLRKIEDNKEALAVSSVDDDGGFNETAFVDELVQSDVVLAPDEEPEAAKATSGGTYMSGSFDADDLARIVGDNATSSEKERRATVPILSEVSDGETSEGPDEVDRQAEAHGGDRDSRGPSASSDDGGLADAPSGAPAVADEDATAPGPSSNDR